MNKNDNWLYEFYKDNTKYVWVVLSLIIVSGFTIGISIGKIMEDNRINENIIAINDIADNNAIVPQIIENNEPIINDINDSVDKISDNNSIIVEENAVIYEPVIPVISSNVEVQEKKLEFCSPIEGEVYREFTENTLIFSDTLNEWVSHSGVDIYGDIATPVKSIECGEIIEVKNDPRYGYVIIIDHGQGYKSVYCNLSTLDMAFVGKYVEKGQVISGIGNTSLFEIKDNPHLHFEMLKDDVLINPLNHIVR